MYSDLALYLCPRMSLPFHLFSMLSIHALGQLVGRQCRLERRQLCLFGWRNACVPQPPGKRRRAAGWYRFYGASAMFSKYRDRMVVPHLQYHCVEAPIPGPKMCSPTKAVKILLPVTERNGRKEGCLDCTAAILNIKLSVSWVVWMY